MINYREKECNSNWRGGLTELTCEDDLLELDKNNLERVKNRFESNFIKLEENSCWIWTGQIYRKSKRARFRVGLLDRNAARVAYVIYKGKINSLCVLHTCDNTLCVNPNHLWLGTNADNSKDMVQKGRQLNQTGSLNHAAKLDEFKVKVIKILLRKGFSQTSIAKHFKVASTTVTLIANEHTWRHVK